MNRLLTAWRLPLRLARRDALRHRARALLVVAMIALPVLAVTTADVLIQTATVSGPESVDRRMGASQALVSVSAETNPLQQAPDPDVGYPVFSGDTTLTAPSAEQVSSLLDGARLVELRRTVGQVMTEAGRVEAQALEVDLADPVADGLVRLTSGRLPRSDGEVVVNAALVADGFRVGDRLGFEVGSEVAGGATGPVVVGTAESTTYRDLPFVAGPLGSLGLDSDEQTQWLVDGGPVTWPSVQRLNELGALVASRAVIEDPPPVSEQYAEVRAQSGTDDGLLPVLALITVMVLLEVVLLAGPAFAVGARAQQRSLALMVASGGTPAQSRRVVLAGAVVLGGTGAVVGVLLGLGLARLLQPVLQDFSQTWFGPFDVPWLHLLAVAAFGLLSAFLAAAVPAVLASRQDVVAVLAGRRGDAPASRRSPVLGAVLLAVGIGASAYGALQPSGGELAIAFGAIPAVLGMILLVPAVLSLVARGAGRLPLTLRYAVRDAHRHRTRTVPAVAAVAATVAGVVALGIGLSSDQREAEETYVSSVAHGVGVVRAYEQPARWDALRAAVEREAPGVQVVEQQGLTDSDGGYTDVQRPDGAGVMSAGSSLGAMFLVSDGPLPPGLVGLSDADARRAEQALGEGRSVVFTGAGVRVDDGEATVVRSAWDEQTGEDQTLARATLPVTYLPLSDPYDGPSAILTPAAAAELGQEPSVVSLLVTGGLDGDQEEAVQEALKGVDPSASIYVERGFQPDSDALIAQLVLLGLGGVLMLGGTLTATFLALSDARPDLATLAAVGASPRTRRGVAAAYALVVGGIGSVLGALVGSIPGVAVTWPLTSSPGFGGGGPTGPFLDVPWLMLLALVVALPVLTALVVGASARSRLPLVSRLD